MIGLSGLLNPRMSLIAQEFGRSILNKNCCIILLRKYSSNTLQHSEKKVVQVPPDVMYTTVKNVQNYKNFVPYCTSSVVTSEGKNHSKARLSVGFGPIQEHYTSSLTFEKPLYVEALCSDGVLFNSLNCMWKFSPTKSKNMCVIDFHVDFEFRSAIYSKVATLFFNELVRTMVSAFEKEAKKQMLLTKFSKNR